MRAADRLQGPALSGAVAATAVVNGTHTHHGTQRMQALVQLVAVCPLDRHCSHLQKSSLGAGGKKGERVERKKSLKK